MKSYFKLNEEEQNDILKEFKNKYLKQYNYTICLFIINVILGILSLIGLFMIMFIDTYLGSFIFTLSLIFLIIDLYFLNRSNQAFYKFLKKKHLKK